MTHSRAITTSMASHTSFVASLKEWTFIFSEFVSNRFRNWKETRNLRDLSDQNLRDIGLTLHDVSLVHHEKMPSSEGLKLAELRRERSVNW